MTMSDKKEQSCEREGTPEEKEQSCQPDGAPQEREPKCQRDCTPQELEWAKKWAKKIRAAAKKCGQHSSDPCYLLEDPCYLQEGGRFKYPKNNENGIDDEGVKLFVGGPSKLTAYWIVFVAAEEYIPELRKYFVRNKLPIWELSHICGNKLCIVASHIEHELRSDNRTRRECHDVIRKFAQQMRLENSELNVVDIKLTVNDIKATANRLGRDIKHECKCKPPCFVNFGEKRRSKKRNLCVRDERSPKRRRLNKDPPLWRRGMTVYYNGVRGWIGKVEDDRIRFCSFDGVTRHSKKEWIAKSETKKKLTFPHLEPMEEDTQSGGDNDRTHNRHR